MRIQGITLSEAPKIGEPLKITVVAAVVKGNSREEVLEEVKLDPYYVNGICDPSKVSLMLVASCFLLVTLSIERARG
jgi:hypothetical protein